MESVLSPSHIRLKTKAKDWQHAVTLAGELLEANGCVEPRYIQATVDAVRMLGPYIVLAPGIAVPHARPEDGALKTGLSLVTLETPVCFGSEENDPVDLVVGLSSVDGKTHIKMFKRICNFLGNDENLEKLRAMRSPEEAATLINTSHL